MTIRRRIAQGYACVLGLALVGTATGVIVGEYWHRKALSLQSLAIAERKLLSDLQVKILYNRPTKQLSPFLEDPRGFTDATDTMADRVAEIQSIVEQHKTLRDELESIAAYNTPEHQELYQQLDRYEVAIAAFQLRLTEFTETVRAINTNDGSLTESQQVLITFVQSQEFKDFIQFPDQLGKFVVLVESEETNASEALETAIALQTQIILGSLLLSILIAGVIAQYTSRAIARPIQSVTDTAHRITEESNFDLQVPVIGTGEVPKLATSFNQIIAKVNQLLTQISQKNTDLEAALHQVNKQQLLLIQAEKMSSLGQLVAGIAHEINNPANFIHGNLAHVSNYSHALIDLLALYEKHYPTPAAEIQDEAEDVDLDFIKDDFPNMLQSMRMGSQRIREIVLS